MLAERERATGTQMVIAIFPSLDGGNVEDFSIRLAEKWRIGQKGLDNGVILVVFVKDRKLRFEVGYGLEPVITDAVASGVIREVIAPRFREGRYAAGLESAVAAVYARIEHGGPAKAGSRSRGTPIPWTLVGFAGIMAVLALMLGLEAYRSRRFVSGEGYTARGGGWGPIIFPGPGPGSGGRSGGGSDQDSGFSGGGGGEFGGGGASGEW